MGFVSFKFGTKEIKKGTNPCMILVLVFSFMCMHASKASKKELFAATVIRP
jgi:hypothetical protein